MGAHRRAPNPARRAGGRCIKEAFLEEVVPELTLTRRMGIGQERRPEIEQVALAFSVPQSSFIISQAHEDPDFTPLHNPRPRPSSLLRVLPQDLICQAR